MEASVFNKLAVVLQVVKGMIGYFRFPDQKTSWGGPFNGQQHRRKIFGELQSFFGFKTIVETGTYRGTTTECFSSMPQVHVYTVESHPWSYGYCWLRFFSRRNVTVLWGDSREQIRRLMKSGDLARPIFFYLDAHWEDDLPLRAELEMILSTWSDAIVMIDDFQVNGDAGYGFDDYGDKKQLNTSYVKNIIDKFNPSLFFPSISGQMESGARRGSIVLLGRQVPQRATSFSTLRRHSLEGQT
jgi:hypothetical protein